MGRKQIPAREDLIDYNHAVAGHAGTLCDADGELFIKPCVQAEIDFYESANRRHPEVAAVLPLYMGTLVLNDPADLSSIEDGTVGPLAADEPLAPVSIQAATSEKSLDNIIWIPNKTKKIKTDLAVVLENASAGFKQPNVLDCKLGVRLWADDAPLQKKQRFDRISAETTHRDHGFRIAGMKAYRGSEDEAELDPDGFRVYDKDFGRLEVNNDNVVDSLRRFVFNEAAGIDAELGRAVCAGFARDIRRVEEVLSRNETRMFSASLLFVFEGDGDALRRAIDENNEALETFISERPARSAARIDSGICLDDDDLDLEDELELPKTYTLKLIDMAHAKWTPGQGPDENTLKGVRSLAKLFEEMSR